MLNCEERNADKQLEYEELKLQLRYEFSGQLKPITNLEEDQEDLNSNYEGAWFLY